MSFREDHHIDKYLQAVERCAICHESFDLRHVPTVLPCRHVFGHTCIKKWFLEGSGNNTGCPICRKEIVELLNLEQDIWGAICREPADRLQTFIQHLWTIPPSYVTNEDVVGMRQFIQTTVITSLLNMAPYKASDPFSRCLSLFQARLHQYSEQPYTPQDDIANHFLRLASLKEIVQAVVPKYMQTSSAFIKVLWEASACVGSTNEPCRWTQIEEAVRLDSDRYFPLLHLVTILMSQDVAHKTGRMPWPIVRHKEMNLVVKQCIPFVEGVPSNELKESLVVVYKELRRCQVELGRISLRGKPGEDFVVKGLWQLACGWQGRHSRKL